MEKSAPPAYTQAPPPPPGYTQANYNTPAHYGVQTAQPPPGGAMPPPPPGMVVAGTVPPPGMGTTTVIVGTQPRRIFTKFPTNIICQHCNQNVVTCPRAEVGLTTWAIVGVLILFGFWLGCCLIPFCIDDCKDIYHDCPNCKNTIDVYKHM